MKYHPALVFLVVAFLVFLSVRIIWSQFIEPIYRPIDEMEEELGVSLVFNFADAGNIVAAVAAVGTGLAAAWATYRGGGS